MVAILDYDDKVAFDLAESIRQWIEDLRMPMCPELTLTARFAVVVTHVSRWEDARKLADSCVYFWKSPNAVKKLILE